MGNATNCLTMGRNRHRPAVLKSVECAKSCMDSWLWLNGTQMAIDWQKCVNWPWVQTISVLGSWPIAKPFQKAYFWSSRLERLVQPHHCLDKKVGWAENCQYHLPLLSLLVLKLNCHHPVVQLGNLTSHHLHLLIHTKAFCAVASPHRKIVLETAAFGNGDISLFALEMIGGLDSFVRWWVSHVFQLYLPG